MNQDITRALAEVFEIIEKSNLILPSHSTFEVYHHYGAKNISKTGAVFINVVNKEYCKSYVVILPGQSYPAHYHKIKVETFYVVYGELKVFCEGNTYTLNPGDMLNVGRGEEHSFMSSTGAVFEEISTTYLRNDSIYIDPKISDVSYEQRKTFVTYEEWKVIKKNGYQRKNYA